jgi:hypothetical protein
VEVGQYTDLFADDKLAFEWNSTGTTVAGVTSVTSTAANRLNHPGAIAIDRSNNLYVCDVYNHRIQRWTPGGTSGITVAGQQSGTWGSSLSQFESPYDVIVDNTGGVYVADAFNHRVMYWANGSSIGRVVAGTGEWLIVHVC